MTNFALALRMEPDLAQNLKAITFMGGAAFCPGNMNDHAEFNMFVDPHAAQIVLQSGVRLTMLGLDVTRKVRVSPARIQAIEDTASHCGRLAARLLTGYAAGDLHLHDPCAVAFIVDTALFSGVQADVHVITHGTELGRTVATPAPDGSCHVITNVDTERVFQLLTKALARLP
jgi:purine nucleosidase